MINSAAGSASAGFYIKGKTMAAVIEKLKEQAKQQAKQSVVVKAPDIRTAVFAIQGTAPYVQARFSGKVMQALMAKMAAGSQARSKRDRPARDFDDDYRQAMHVSTEGWHGIPASAFRQAMISACRLVGYKMTLAKLSVWIDADGIDKVDGQPLIKISGEPERSDMAVRNETGVLDIRVRPMWRDWSAEVRVSYDADQFSQTDVANLMMRVGMQVGIGEGRPDSRKSAGLGWGTFKLL